MPIAGFSCMVKPLTDSIFLLLLCIVVNWMYMLVAEFFQRIEEGKYIADWSANHYLRRWDITVWVRGIAELHNSSQKAVSIQDSCWISIWSEVLLCRFYSDFCMSLTWGERRWRIPHGDKKSLVAVLMNSESPSLDISSGERSSCQDNR